MDKVIPNRAENAINMWKSFMIVYYRACTSSQPTDYFHAARIAKALEFYLRKNCSLWQCLKFAWLLHKHQANDEQFK